MAGQTPREIDARLAKLGAERSKHLGRIDHERRVAETLQEAARKLGYRAIRVLQWHADYGSEPQDSLLVLATTAPEDEVHAPLPTA